MAKYPIKMLKDENNIPFVPLVGTDAIVDPSGDTLEQKLATKLESANIIQGPNITLEKDGNNITISATGKGAIVDNLDTTEPGVGALDARQGNILKNMIPTIANNLTTIDATQTLSAYQGYILNNRVVPKGGDEGQVLKKSADGDWQLEWGDAADPNAISGDGSIKKIISLTWAEYNELEEIDESTEYHIIDINTEAQDNTGVPEVYIQETKPDRDDWKLWINPEDETWAAGSEVVNSLEGNETALAPSVAAINKYIGKKGAYEQRMLNIDGFSWTDNQVWSAIPYSRVFESSNDDILSWNSDNTFTIKEGINRIRITANIAFCATSGTNSWLMTAVYKNGVGRAKRIDTGIINMWNTATITEVLDVKNGDVLNVAIYQDAGNTYLLHNLHDGWGGGPTTYLLVEVIE